MELSLIANTGIQFFVSEFEVKADDTFTDSAGNIFSPLSIKDENDFSVPLVFHESYSIMDDAWTLELAASFSDGKVVRLDELRNHKPAYAYIDETTGCERLVDEAKIDFDSLELLPPDSCYNEYNLAGSIAEKLAGGKACPLDTLENQWLPMPMFEKDSNGNSVFGPAGWCRMKLVPMSKARGTRRYRLVWAFDTTSAHNDSSGTMPFFYDGEGDKRYGLCNDFSLLFNFFSPKPYDCEWVDDYIVTLIHGSKSNSELVSADGDTTHFRYIAYYMTMVAYFRSMGLAPDVNLYTDEDDSKPVDLVLDIGNSRTCGVLFENSDFTKVDMLQLQDLTEPWKVYKKPFDMRLAFHRCKFGEIDLPDQFLWQSFLRVGDEAIKLIYKSRPADGLAERTTNYSSPKRYLWDDRQFDGQWDFLTTDDDSTTLSHYINIKGLSEQFGSDGTLRRDKTGGIFSSFSRRSLMTFVMIEILQQANCQINSQQYREKMGDINIKRKLRTIVITCPTAMPTAEQVILRQCAEEAYIALLRCKDPTLYYEPYDPAEWQGKIKIVPSVKELTLNPNTPMGMKAKAEWGYDEATCCQLVYLYAEVAQRYLNHCEDFFNLYGHVRKEFKDDDYNRNSLTIGSIDIGAGTTDLMVCAYKYDAQGVCKLTPKPLFWDSFYYAGDDILEELVRAFIIEGKGDEAGAAYDGPIFNAVRSNYMAMPDDDFVEALGLKGKVNLAGLTEAERQEVKLTYASKETSERLHNFFGRDKAIMDYKDRIIRQDFNVQVSVPMGIKMLDMLRLGRKQARLTYSDFFADLQPADFIIEHFNRHFSLASGDKVYAPIDFRKIVWNFNPEEISKLITAKTEPLMKQLAIVLHTYNCDIVLLAGKPMSLNAITDLFLKYYPTSPNRLIRLNNYRVGEWYPFADGLGYFKDQKSLVAVGAMIGYMASNGGMNGFHMDMTQMKKDMVSTANYLGLYNTVNQKVAEAVLSPDKNSATIEVHGFPLFIGCKQLSSMFYQARPLFSLTLADGVDPHTVSLPLRVSVVRNFSQDKESLKIATAYDSVGRPFSTNKLHLGVQSLAGDGSYWLDKGEFVLSINGQAPAQN